MDAKNIAEKKWSVPFCLVLIGAILGIIAYFIPVFNGLTGAEILDQKSLYGLGMLANVPVMIMILGIVGVIIGSMSIFDVKIEEKTVGTIYLIAGLICLAGMFFLYTGEMTVAKDIVAIKNVTDIGFVLNTIASVLIAFSGLVVVLNSKR